MARPATFVALIGDLVGSRDLAAKPRAELQFSLQGWLEWLNEELGPDLAAPLTLTAGDAIQGLFRKPSRVVRVVQELTDRLFSFQGQPRMVFGAGRGPLATGRIPAAPGRADNPALLDGMAFHKARAALEKAQDEGAWTCFVGFDQPPTPGKPPDVVVDVVLDALFLLMGTIRERWTVKQGARSFSMRKTRVDAATQKHVTQRLLAERMGVSPSVVSETLKASRHIQLIEGEEAARVLLATLDPGAR